MLKSRKIAVDLQGGLGNQLFCYSAGYYVAAKNNFDLECWMTSKFNSANRDTSILSSLQLPGKFLASPDRPNRSYIIIGRIFRKLKRHLDLFIRLQNTRTYNSQCIGYDENLETIGAPIYLHGYFQTWRFANVTRGIIKTAINKEVHLSDYALDLIEQLESRKILVMHIRLGDYREPENSFIGVLSPKYFEAVLKKIDLQMYKVFVFSDDIIAAKIDYKEHFPARTVWIDEKNTLTSIETLAVMSHGKAFAIANSTFSWWAAFLSEKPDFVIAPAKWFKSKEDPGDLLPANWIREASQWSD